MLTAFCAPVLVILWMVNYWLFTAGFVGLLAVYSILRVALGQVVAITRADI
jgi:hypothetical protein